MMLPVVFVRLWQRRRAALLWFVALGMLAASAGLTHRYTLQLRTEQLRTDASHQLDVLAEAIDGVMTKHAAIPSAIGVNQEVLQLLQAGPQAGPALRNAANRFLEKLNAHLGGPALFVMDLRGRVVASSDWIFSANLVNEDLSYMPFFRSALQGIPARHYAIDHVRPEPGYFFAQPIRDEQRNWEVIGVAVVKSSLRELEQRWFNQETPAVIVDNNDVVVLSSPPHWRYASLKPLSGEALVDFDQRPYADRQVALQSLEIPTEGTDTGIVIQLPKALRKPMRHFSEDGSYLVLSRQLPATAWRVLLFSDLRQVRLQAASMALLSVAALGCFWLGCLYLWQRRKLERSREQARALMARSHQELERQVSERTEKLSAMIYRLRREISERKKAEQTLRAAQNELVQAAKLAVVGQMAAGITHELAQPLSAIRTLSANAAAFMELGDQATAQQNLGLVGQLVDQMGHIIQPLKSFCRKSPSVSNRLDPVAAIEAALLLFHPRLEKQGVRVHKPEPEPGLAAWGDANRLQQVLVNLIGNALDAMSLTRDPALHFVLSRPENWVEIRVQDHGPGLDLATQAHLFEPFFTTKPPGEGLGLGLTISRDILRDFGGDLFLDPHPERGACFVVRLPAAKENAIPS